MTVCGPCIFRARPNPAKLREESFDLGASERNLR